MAFAVVVEAYERGIGFGVVVMDTREQAERLAEGFPVGAGIRDGVTVTRAEVLQVSATA